MRSKTITVFANPYHALDHEGRLAGACPEGEKPYKRRVGATPQITKGSHKPDSADIGLRIKVADRQGNLGAAPLIMSRADLWWKFSADPIAIVVEEHGALDQYYGQRVRHGELLAADGDSVPLDALAAARASAIADWTAHHGEALLDFDAWAEQYPLDQAVANHAHTEG
jgi:hypothetical protein